MPRFRAASWKIWRSAKATKSVCASARAAGSRSSVSLPRSSSCERRLLVANVVEINDDTTLDVMKRLFGFAVILILLYGAVMAYVTVFQDRFLYQPQVESETR